jgi:hypothetical protein
MMHTTQLEPMYKQQNYDAGNSAFFNLGLSGFTDQSGNNIYFLPTGSPSHLPNNIDQTLSQKRLFAQTIRKKTARKQRGCHCPK